MFTRRPSDRVTSALGGAALPRALGVLVVVAACTHGAAAADPAVVGRWEFVPDALRGFVWYPGGERHRQRA